MIHRCADFGPATKILALGQLSIINLNDIIIVCDDDRIYDYNFIQKLVSGLGSKPDCCVTNAGWEIETLSQYTYQKTNLPRGIEYQSSGYVDILGGCCGFALYYKQFIDSDMMNNIDTNSPSYFVDDVWISGHLTINNIKIWILETGTDAIRSLSSSVDSLATDNNHRKICNDYAIKYFIDKYHIWNTDFSKTTTVALIEPANNEIISNAKSVFENIYKTCGWGNGSGPGSTIEYNVDYVGVLKRLFDDLEIKSVVDIGCGDWQFSRHIDFNQINYTGIDVVEQLIQTNTQLFSKPNIHFVCLDIIQNPESVPESDLIILKDVVQHWPTKTIIKILTTVKSKAKYILLVNCCHQNDPLDDINLGEYRPLSHTMYPLQLFCPIFIKKYYSKEILLIKC